ncbi:MAG: amidohydrolase family protein [Armatimonadetes bacterium]|nr:amidohydrolase family protein [Armatimonadota bacterium]
MSSSGFSRREILVAGGSALAASSLGFSPILHADYDLVIANGRLIDPDSKTDGIRYVGIRGGTVAAISKTPIKGRKTIDATGLVVAPGFIDPISHGQDLENDQVQVFDGLTTKLQLEAGVRDQDQWHKAQKGNRICNYGAGVGHPTIRGEVMGNEHDAELSPSTPAQVDKMANIIDEQLRKGAIAVGYGFEYVPGSTRMEAFRMFEVAGKHEASCHVHMRYGTYLEEQSVFTAIEEVVALSLMTDAPLHIVHVPSMALGQTKDALMMINRAQKAMAERGYRFLTCDFYPYTAFGTGISSEVFAEGWQQRFGIDYPDLEYAKTHERLTKETFEKYRAAGGMVIAHAIPEAAVQAAIQNHGAMVGSDGGLTKGVGHPRSAGTFCRVLGRYSRELKLIDLSEAIRKMTIMAAKRMEHRCPDFKRKGRVQRGSDADIIVFDPKTVSDRATFDEPALTSIGMHHVLINGVQVIENGKLRDVRPGTGLRTKEKH